MESLGYQHVSDQWRLFIDASKTSLKAVLLYNRNTKPSLPLAYAVNMKESYESMKILLEAIEYSKHSWKVCGDLKVISLLLDLQLGYTKHMCFFAFGTVAMTVTTTAGLFGLHGKSLQLVDIT